MPRQYARPGKAGQRGRSAVRTTGTGSEPGLISQATQLLSIHLYIYKLEITVQALPTLLLQINFSHVCEMLLKL